MIMEIVHSASSIVQSAFSTKADFVQLYLLTGGFILWLIQFTNGSVCLFFVELFLDSKELQMGFHCAAFLPS